MADEIAVADTGASAASTEAAAPAATPTETPLDTASPETTEQPTPQTFDETLFDGQETEVPTEQAGQYDALLSLSPYIQDEQTLQNAIQRQGQVEAVLQGQAPAASLFEPMRQQNPEQWASLMNGVADYLQNVTGMKLVDPSQTGGQPLTPEQQRIQQLEQQQQSWQQQQQQERQQRVVNQAQKQLSDKLPELTKGRFIDGESPDWIMQQLSYKLAGKENQVISAITKGDYTMVQKAIAQISHEERIMFNSRGKRIASQRNALKAAVPKTAGKGTPEMVLPSEKIDTSKPNWFGDVATRIMKQ
jgi:hypothetical protein